MYSIDFTCDWNKNTTTIGSAIKDHLGSKIDLENHKANFDGIPSFTSSQFNINATMKYPHMECDQSSTNIFVTNQTMSNNN